MGAFTVLVTTTDWAVIVGSPAEREDAMQVNF
jgi:hypothetical protein